MQPDEWNRMTTCKWCGEEIIWHKTASGAWQPLNLDGAVHFPTCRKRVEAGREKVRQWYRELEAATAAVNAREDSSTTR